MIDVAIVEDDADIREGLALLIRGTPGYHCCGAYPDCETALAQIAAHPPDVLVLDIELPGISGIAGIRKFRQILPELAILILTMHEEDSLIFDSLCAGACGYLVKTTPPARLLQAIAEIADGGAPMTASIARRVIQSLQKSPQKAALTPRETEILALLCRGYSYKMIAAELVISRGTVHCHIKNIYKKLHVSSNAAAVAKAIREHLV